MSNQVKEPTYLIRISIYALWFLSYGPKYVKTESFQNCPRFRQKHKNEAKMKIIKIILGISSILLAIFYMSGLYISLNMLVQNQQGHNQYRPTLKKLGKLDPSSMITHSWTFLPYISGTKDQYTERGSIGSLIINRCVSVTIKYQSSLLLEV